MFARRPLLAVLLITAVLRPVPARNDTLPDAVDRIWNHLGGRGAFEEARVLEFTWAVEKGGARLTARHHLWDRYSGSYVFGMREKESGDSIEVHMNVTTRKGSAFRNGVEMGAEQSLKQVENAYAAYINDSYWLLCPTKLEDPGVKLTMVTEDSLPGVSVLHLAFENVGLTPGDQYWLYVQGDGRITRWRYLLESGREGIFEWRDEKDCGMGIRLSTNKVAADGNVRIYFPVVRFSEHVDESRFLAPPD
jgi:hypothetical protein